MSEGTGRGISVGLALTIATASQMVFGELVPKNFAIARPPGVARRIVPALKLNNVLFSPLINFLNNTANATVRLFGIEPREEITGMRSLEELDLLVRSSREAGTLQDEEYSLLARSIDFGEKTAAEALIPRTAMNVLPKAATLGDMADLARSSGHSRFPVFGDDIDDIIGLVHIKDLFAVPLGSRDEHPDHGHPAGTALGAGIQRSRVAPDRDAA